MLTLVPPRSKAKESPSPGFLFAALCLVLCGMVLTPGAARGDDPDDPLSVWGDFRLRLEQDWDSQQADGTPREDRLRLRGRARLGVAYELTENLRFALRLRSGADDSQQSANLTLVDFDDNDTGAVEFNIDQWYVRGDRGGLWGWAGRNGPPFWKQNELFWDGDVTVAGGAGGWVGDAGDGQVSLSAGHFSLPAGMRRFSGTMTAGQAAWARPASGSLPGLAAAAGLYDIEANPDDPDGDLLLNGNGDRDYSILAAMVQGRGKAGPYGWVVGLDLFRNLEDYGADDPDPFTVRHRDDRDGWAVSASVAGLGREDVVLSYTYAHIEALAVHSSYAQDDWVRWGTANQTRATGFEGHELQVAFQATRKLKMAVRYFDVEALGNAEDGRRIRLDLNLGFGSHGSDLRACGGALKAAFGSSGPCFR